MSIARMCPYDKDEHCKYERYFGEPMFSKCENCEIKIGAVIKQKKRKKNIELSNAQIKNSDTLCKIIGEQKIKIAELEAQIEKLIDFVLSKTECCDVCPITDTCINSEGTCPYAGILSKGEEAVTREWLMQKIAKEIKENAT